MGNRKAANAFCAMNGIGISKHKASRCSKTIVNGEVSEQSKKIVSTKKENFLKEETLASDELRRSSKRLRHRDHDDQASILNTYDRSLLRTPIVGPKGKPCELPETHLLHQDVPQGMVDSSQPNAGKKQLKSQTAASQSCSINKGKQPTSPKTLTVNEKNDPFQPGGINGFQIKPSSSHPMRLRNRGKGSVSSQSKEVKSVFKTSPDVGDSEKPKVEPAAGIAPIKPKVEPIICDVPHLELPSGVVHPIRNGRNTDDGRAHGDIQENGTEEINSSSLVGVWQAAMDPETFRSPRDVIDVAKGLEKVVITLVNEVNDEGPPSFFYIPHNAVFQDAYLNFSLARMGDNHCCSTCFVDCLSLSIPCACAHETGGEFAYTTDGLVKEEFLNECISMNRNPKNHCQFFCKECALERSKTEDVIEPCKGHLVRKFIKECWWKCGCSNQCGNRVVQRGITRNLQVFMSPEGKGWGLRTLEDLPKGAFVCEYVGEVLTNAELFDRVQRGPKGAKHSYPVLLDADWGAEEVLKDEEALCLDATYYGNVARFINHRCYDSNMVEIPVEVETPDHHYYHLAFFTTRKVKALEELTWDYGIDFEDHGHPIRAFRCQCGSKFCRNIRPSSKQRSSRRRWR